MKPSLDSDEEEEELGALQKTLRGNVNVFKHRKDDSVQCCCLQNCNNENNITENQSINQLSEPLIEYYSLRTFAPATRSCFL